ncbi:MAG: response regulator, partial [Deltaproteobacteria bacterium]|nr:response regulator [Deltaproteobacteria bacterium]
MDERKADAPVKILFVDDEVNILRSIRRLLMEQPWEVLTAASGEEGVKVLESNRDVGLIVSDQRMPGLSGVDFLEKAKEMAPHAMRFMLTGYADIQATVDAINRGGAHRYISKPWSDDELVQVVRDGVHRYGLLAENLRLQGVVKRQNEELTLWNEQLKRRVLERTAEIRRRNEDLQRLNERLKEEFRSSIAAFSGLIELRDEEMRNHSRNVA